MARGEALVRAPRAPRAAPGGRSDAVADVLADDAGAQAGDLRPLRGVHLRSRHSSPSADSNRSSPSGAAPTATQTNRWSLRSADILPAQMYVGIGQPENLDRIWVIPGCRDQSVKAWSGPVKSRTARTRRKVTGGPGGARSSWRQGTGTSGRRPPRPRAARPGAGLAPRATESQTARAIGRKSPFAKRAPGDGRPVGAIAVTPGDRRQSAVSSK